MRYSPRDHGARCDLCPLAKDGVVVPPSPVKDGKTLRLVVVGEGPGKAEEKLREPFVGMSGKFLDERLRRDAKVARDDCHVTNAALCRGESDDENEEAAECCAPRLLRELEELPSSVPIAALGKTAVRSLLGIRSILTARGFVWHAPEILEKNIKAATRTAYKAHSARARDVGLVHVESLKLRIMLQGRIVLPTIHPAFVLRADTWKPISELDFRRIGRVARGELAAPFEDECVYSVGGPEVLAELNDVVSCDIETDGIRALECNILSIGLADKAGHVVEIWPWTDGYAGRVAHALKSKFEVVFHNGNNFDLLVLENHGVVW